MCRQRIQSLNIFVVESPLQALMMTEAIGVYASNRNVALVRYAHQYRARNNIQIDSILNSLPGSIEIIKFIDPDSGALATHLNRAKSIRKLVRYKKKSEAVNLFIGDFRSEWMHFLRVLLRPKKTIILDDGAATLTCYYDSLVKDILWPSRFINKGIKFRFISCIYGCAWPYSDARFTEKLELFTTFKLESTPSLTVKMNDFSVLRNQLISNQAGDYAMHIGSKYSEAGIMTLTNELDCLEHVKDYYRRKGIKDVYYIVHRDESVDKVNVISSQLGFKPLYLNSPIEISFMNFSKQPIFLSGIYSTAVFNVRILFPSVMTLVFRPCLDIFEFEHRKNIERVYAFAQALTEDGFMVEDIKVVPSI